MYKTRHLICTLIPLIGLACGGPLADGEYPGEALLTLEGSVRDASPLDDDNVFPTEVRLAIFWAHGGLAELGHSVSTSEHRSFTRGVFPAKFTLQIHTPPPLEVLATATVSGQYALGLIAAYADIDGNGAWTDGTDTIVGHAHELVVLYTPNGAQDARFEAPNDSNHFGPGFHQVELEASETACTNDNIVKVKGESDAHSLIIEIDVTGTTSPLPKLDCD